MMTWSEFVERAISVPFLEKGRSFDGWDCWGLCVVGYRELYDLQIVDRDYPSTKDYRTIHRLFTEGRRTWRQVVVPTVGNVAIIFRRGLDIHAGLVGEREMILHVEEQVGTVQEPIKDFRVEGFYEYC